MKEKREQPNSLKIPEAVDRGQILWMLSLTPKERLLHLEQTVNSLLLIRAARKR